MGSRSHARKKHRIQQRKDQGAYKFAVDERVLCYEPDQKKARVLYDSKVLEVVERTDNRGKVRVEYKIHFFGWNSSWDRYVAEDCVLKDTDENRDLQKELKAKADVLIQSHLKKKKRKKTLSEIVKEKTGKGTKLASGEIKNEDDTSNSSGSSDSSDQESSDEEDKKSVTQINLTTRVKYILEQDYFNVMKRNMLVRIPAEVSVICIFEGYVKYLGFRELRKFVDKYKPCFSSNGTLPLASTASTSTGFTASGVNTKASSNNNKVNPNELWMEDIARIYRKVRQAQEIVHGLKVIFDYMLYQMLLYEVENEQYKSHKRMKPRMPDINCSLLIPQLPVRETELPDEIGEKQQKKNEQEADTVAKQNKPVPGTSREQQSETLSKLRRHTKTITDDSVCKERKSERKLGDTSSHSKSILASQLQRVDADLWTKSINKYINELQSWQMLPEECYQQEHPDPCMVYGLIHVLRFFVKLPEIFNRMPIPNRKVRIIAHHVNQMVEHVQTCYVFNVSRLYISLPRSVYEEDQIRVAPPASDEDKSINVREVEKDLSQYSTRSYRSIVLCKVKPQLAKVVEVPLSTASETLEEHQLTIRTGLPLKMNSGSSSKVTKSASNNEKTATASSTAVKTSKAKDEPKEVVVKKEPDSDPAPQKTSLPNKKKPNVTTSANEPPPVLPMVRQVRKSAAHAAFKTAHMFASQQSITSRTLAASTIVSQEPEEGREGSRKRSSQGDVTVNEPKRITRLSDTKPPAVTAGSSTSTNKPVLKRSRQEQKSNEQLSKGSSKSPMGRRGSDSPTRRCEPSTSNRSHRSSRSSGLSPVHKNKSSEPERKHSTPDKTKTVAKRISSPRTSKSFSSSKDVKPANRTIHKSISPTSNTIRLRSRSDERQLRSRGTLINAYALPMQTAPRSSHSSKPEEDKSPRRRESTGNSRDSGGNSNSGTKSAEVAHNLRGSRR